MQIKDHLREEQAFLSRAIIAALLVILVLGALVVRLAQLQVVEHAHYTTLSKDNRVKLVPLPPTRGLVYDRNGILLALNRPAYSLELVPERVEGDIDATLERLGEYIEIGEDDLERFHKLKRRKRRFDSVPVRVNLDLEEAAHFAVVSHLFPGVDIKAQLLRHYPFEEATAHVLGYVGRISRQDLETIEHSQYAGTSHIGKIGLEKTYESMLHGSVGVQQVEVNSVGRVVRVLEETPPVPGQDLHLHLDVRLQQIALDALGDNNGAVVALDPKTGGVLVLASKPGYNPNLFVEGISSKAYRALQGNRDNPLYDRALRGQYPPGSTVKPFIGLAGLETGTMRYDTSVYCPGFFQLPGHEHKYRDWKKGGHGLMDLDTAITQSCDVYYYKLAYEMGIDAMSEFLQQFGFGEKTGIDLSGESSGILPSREWKRKTKRQPWYPGETVISGIGQGYFLTTPIQLAAATAALANNGHLMSPRIVAFSETRPEYARTPLSSNDRPIPIQSQADWDDVHNALLHVVQGARGTARRIQTDFYSIAGKTGTAQVFSVAQEEEYIEEEVAKKHRDHALFVAYAPAEDPQIAIAVVVENGGSGSATAAPVARKVLDAYLLPRLYGEVAEPAVPRENPS